MISTKHPISIDYVQKFSYHQADTTAGGRRGLRSPPFFIDQDDKSFNSKRFPAGSETEHRIPFFAQYLTASAPESLPTDAMPTFMVRTPHYIKKVCLLRLHVDRNFRNSNEPAIDLAITTGGYP
jgi:1,3-beta-glucan synthase